MSAGFDFPGQVERIEAALVAALDLRPHPLPAGLERAGGAFRGQPVALRARAWAGGPVRYARFVTLAGPGLQIGNLLAFGRPELALPVLGADLVAIGAGPGLVAADLSPAPAGGASLEGLARRRAGAPALPPGGELPGWAARWFSPQALFARPAPGQAAEAEAALLAFPQAFAELARAAPAANLAAEADRAQRDYARDHRDDDKGLNLLARLFDPAWSRRFLDEVLFPVVLP